MTDTKTIDLTPTWGEIGNIYTRLAETGEANAARQMRPDVALAFAAAQAFKEIQGTLTPAQFSMARDALNAELKKQGQPTPE